MEIKKLGRHSLESSMYRFNNKVKNQQQLYYYYVKAKRYFISELVA